MLIYRWVLHADCLLFFQLWSQRIAAGAESHGLHWWDLNDGLHKSNIQLNRKVLSELAVWEPATFECLAKIAADKNKQ